ncbi:hypothetical protein [Geodermatophilus ruber]|uniref:hypothetical protein n=1 Tax=Geodermatophilus ruber TaxID=504800 RepID=UPI0015A7254E|nr:hypothetical protein [Geodermatophilus ruber]
MAVEQHRRAQRPQAPAGLGNRLPVEVTGRVGDRHRAEPGQFVVERDRYVDG